MVGQTQYVAIDDGLATDGPLRRVSLDHGIGHGMSGPRRQGEFGSFAMGHAVAGRFDQSLEQFVQGALADCVNDIKRLQCAAPDLAG